MHTAQIMGFLFYGIPPILPKTGFKELGHLSDECRRHLGAAMVGGNQNLFWLYMLTHRNVLMTYAFGYYSLFVYNKYINKIKL